MYSQFIIARQLPNIENALGFQKCLVIGNYFMMMSLIHSGINLYILITFAV